MTLTLPKILNIPPKLMPLITDFNKYKYFLIEGGRGSSKTQTVARLLLAIAELRKVRIMCGREIQGTIEESVHAVLSDLITDYELAYKVRKNGILHLLSKSTFKFKGFREQGSVNIKGVEGVDIVWIDEAEAITKKTLDKLIPTIRKSKSKLIFTMNRFMRDDAVVEELAGRDDCLHIKINYFENPFCPLTLKVEAEVMKNKSEREYNHIWLGMPLATADDYLFNFDRLHDSLDVVADGALYTRQRILGIDFAAQGNDQCVAVVLDRTSNQHWRVSERIAWDEPDTTISVGKIAGLIGTYKPDVTILDVGGGGHNVHCDLTNAGLKIQRFDGGSTEGVNTKIYGNQRAQGYYELKEWFEQRWIKIEPKDKEIIKQAEKIKMRWRPNGVRLIEDKKKMKAEIGYSPDDVDALMMAVYAAKHYLGKPANADTNAAIPTKRISTSKRRR